MDIVSMFDHKYSGKGAVECGNEGKPVKLAQSGITHVNHGNLTVHGSGTFLICGVCGYSVPTSNLEVE